MFNTFIGYNLIISAVDCSTPNNHHTTTVSVPVTTVNAIATYTCAAGYETLDGNAQRTCQSDGTWSGMAPTCSDIRE